MTLLEVTREAAREAVQMYFEPITSLFGLTKRQGGEQRFGLAERFNQAGARTASKRLLAPTRDSKSSPARQKALVVEKDPATRDVLVDLIASNGIDVDVATDGEMAVDYLSRDAFDVVILNLVLPKISGTRILGRLAEVQPEMLAKTIVITTADLSEIRRLFPNVRDAFAKSEIPTRLLPAMRLCIEAEAEERQQTA